MTDFEEIKKVCDGRSAMSARVIDEFLVYYAGEKDNLSREFDQRISNYRQVTQQLDPSWVRRLKSQYIVHKIFRKGGLLRKYLNHVDIKRLPAEELEFLRGHLDCPWRYCFSVLIENPHPDFYRMQDVFTGDVFLLYSRSVTEVLKEQPVRLWFNLIGSNGSCWQTFGPVIGYQSFDADDIFFFATEMDPRIEDEDMLLADVEKNAVPYMLLLMGSRSPVTVSGNDELFMLYSEHDIASIDTERLKTDFRIEHRDGVYRLSPVTWNHPPHLADVYYDEGEKLLAVTSTTERGFDAVIALLNQHGIDIPSDSGVRVRPTMLITAERILKKVILLNPYDELFQEEESNPESKAELERLNNLMSLVIPLINEGKKPDVEALARETGVDPAVAQQVVTSAMERIEALKKGSA